MEIVLALTIGLAVATGLNLSTWYMQHQTHKELDAQLAKEEKATLWFKDYLKENHSS
jgi:hypothetical protein